MISRTWLANGIARIWVKVACIETRPLQQYTGTKRGSENCNLMQRERCITPLEPYTICAHPNMLIADLKEVRFSVEDIENDKTV